MRVAGQQQRADGREALAQRGEVAVEHGVGLGDRGALLVAERGRVRVEVARQLPDAAHQRRVPDPRDVGAGGARQHEGAHGALPGLHEARDRLVGAELAGGDRDQVEPPDQALERDVDPGEAGERQPGVGSRLPEREPRDDLDLDRERLLPHREDAVHLVEPERGPAEGQQPLAAEVELEARLLRGPALGHGDLGMRQPPHAVAARPRRPERQRLAVEAPVAELHPVAHEPRAQLVGAGGQRLPPLLEAQGHARSVAARSPEKRSRVLLAATVFPFASSSASAERAEAADDQVRAGPSLSGAGRATIRWEYRMGAGLGSLDLAAQPAR